LVASVRETRDLSRLAAAGLHTFTLSPALLAALFEQPETLAAARQFELDAGA
jgi:transaldolase